MIAALIAAEILGIAGYLAAWNLPYRRYWSALIGVTCSVLVSVPAAVFLTLALT